jgi:hypothetical protein
VIGVADSSTANHGAKTLPKVMVVGNCHCLPLADAFALCGRVASTDFIDVSFTQQPAMAAKIDALADPNAYDVVFSIPLHDNFGQLATDRLRTLLGDRLRTHTNIHFTGLHPDITYIGAMHRRVPGFFGDYHSKIVLFSFVTGRSARDAQALFNGQTYQRLGYFDHYAASAAELRQRDGVCDIKFANAFLEMVPREVTMYTFNHPTGRVFLTLAAAMANAAGIKFIRHGMPVFQNHLSTNYIWPVYGEIAEHHQLAYRTPPVFIRAAQRGPRSVDLGEFIAGSYAAYTSADLEDLRQMAASLPFYAAFSAALAAP